MIGYAICGSFCTLERSLAQLEKLVAEGFDVQPILSENAFKTDTRFMLASDLRTRVEALTDHTVISTFADAEPLGPKRPLEALILAPCTGNTLAKIAGGITDTSATMAVKAHLRCDRPTLFALASNDALSQNLRNIGSLLLRKQVFFLPMKQDDPIHKPHSLVADFERLSEGLAAALEGRQLRPLFL